MQSTTYEPDERSSGHTTVLIHSLNTLMSYVEGKDFFGFDPYDALNGWIPFSAGGRWTQALWTQFHKRNPVNLRRLIGIAPGRNPKGIGLFLSAYSKWANDNGDDRIGSALFEWLLENQAKGYTGSCWGYNFDWVNPIKTVKAGVPSVVVTAFVAKGLFDYFRLTGEPRARETILSCCDYVLETLPRTETGDGVCFSYTHLRRDCCFNANMLAAEILAMGYNLGGEESWSDLSQQAMFFTLAHQKEDGRWNYSRELETGQEREQIDFHQGFVLDSIDAVSRLTRIQSSLVEASLRKGVTFYRDKQFFPDGRSQWRWPREWPVEIHNQAQGILSLVRLRRLDPDYHAFAATIAEWTIAKMQDERGFFYYQKFRAFTNKIPYMRWAQAWMLLALVELTQSLKEENR